MWKSAVNADKNALPVFVKVVDYGLHPTERRRRNNRLYGRRKTKIPAGLNGHNLRRNNRLYGRLRKNAAINGLPVRPKVQDRARVSLISVGTIKMVPPVKYRHSKMVPPAKYRLLWQNSRSAHKSVHGNVVINRLPVGHRPHKRIWARAALRSNRPALGICVC